MKGILFAIVLALSPIVSTITQQGYSTNQDYEWVDLGLPSGLLWASRNAGASSPEGFGKYFAAGGGWEKDENGAIRLGRGGMVPSEANWKELWSYCTWKWVSRGVVNGWLVVSRQNNNSIFLPAAGYKSGKTLKFADTQGYYASSTMDDEDENSAKYFYFSSRYLGNYKISKSEELTVRLVRKKEVISVREGMDDFDYEVDESEEDTYAPQLVESKDYSIVASGTTGTLSWDITDNGSLILTGQGNMPNYETGTSPWYNYRHQVKEVIIEQGINNIGQAAFQHLDQMQKVSIPSSVKTIGGWGFYGCSKLTTLELPTRLQSIGTACFAECHTLAKVTMNSAATMGWRCFWNCKKLDQFICYADSVPPIDRTIRFQAPNQPFGGGAPSSRYLHVPAHLVNQFSTDEQWGTWKNIQAIRIEKSDKSWVPEAVDLGLSVKWANMNLGAHRPEEYGDYYAWGETESKSDYTWLTYKFCTDGNSDANVKLSKYNTSSAYGRVDDNTELDAGDDVAHVKLGGNWRMPTRKEWDELMTKGSFDLVLQNDVIGLRIIGPNGKSIFLAAACNRDDIDFDHNGFYGLYWTSSLRPKDPTCAYNLYFTPVEVEMIAGGRYKGQSVRPVFDESLAASGHRDNDEEYEWVTLSSDFLKPCHHGGDNHTILDKKIYVDKIRIDTNVSSLQGSIVYICVNFRSDSNPNFAAYWSQYRKEDIYYSYYEKSPNEYDVLYGDSVYGKYISDHIIEFDFSQLADKVYIWGYQQNVNLSGIQIGVRK